ncbi:hypothetical protein C8R44DRAFT_871423 [Mycena epipterygia]|nr:hypothetical protein C8R44DRAFT_871423 [Mycena epipterygia]
MHVLTACDATVNLQLFFGSPDLLPLLGPLPLRRLSVKITHLDLYDWPLHGWEPLSGLAQMPCLTHLSFHRTVINNIICRGILLHCQLLEVLAIFCSNKFLELSVRAYASLSIDPRFMILLHTNLLVNWEMGDEDYWVRADNFVRKRRSEEMENLLSIPNHFLTPTTIVGTTPSPELDNDAPPTPQIILVIILILTTIVDVVGTIPCREPDNDAPRTPQIHAVARFRTKSYPYRTSGPYCQANLGPQTAKRVDGHLAFTLVVRQGTAPRA